MIFVPVKKQVNCHIIQTITAAYNIKTFTC
jgi:hypothetical protein